MYAAGAELSEEVGFDGVGRLPRTGKRVTSVQDLRDLGQASWALSDILEAPVFFPSQFAFSMMVWFRGL